MRFLYVIGIQAYGIVIRIASLFNPKAKEWVKGRKDQTYHEIPHNKRVIWFHCASLGEFDQGIPLMNEWKSHFPEDYILVTFFSPSGMLNCNKRNHPADEICYLPLDTTRNAKRFIKHFQPHIGIFIKYEFWHQFIREAKASNVKLYSVSTLLREQQVYFKWYGRYFRKSLELFDHFFAQTTETKSLLQRLGIEQCSVTGDTRYDKVISNRKNVTPEPIIESFKGDNELLIIGSSWPIDERIIIPVVNELNLKVVIAPHQIDHEHVLSIETKLERPFIRFTEADADTVKDRDVLILDTIGQLSNAYQYGDIAYVGGGFTGSLHNILEPGVFGLPVLFGPKHNKYPEASLFLQEKIAFEVTDRESVIRAILNCLESKDQIKLRAEKFVEGNTGASQRIFNVINSN